MAAEKNSLSRQFWQSAETKISAGPSRITGPAELNEMIQYPHPSQSTRIKFFFSNMVEVAQTAKRDYLRGLEMKY